MTYDYKKYDKDGKELNLIPLAKRANQANYYQRWVDDTASVMPTDDDIKCELQLQALSYWEPLSIKIKRKVQDELTALDDMWQPYLRRDGIMNDREGIPLFSIPGLDMKGGISMPDATKAMGRPLSELEFNQPTEAYYALPSLHTLLDYWQPLGRTFLVKLNAGGYFPPHKDTPLLTRNTFRVVAFLSDQNSLDQFEWEMDRRPVPTKEFTAYYCDTRQTHRTHSWAHNCIHLIMNIPKTWENVMKVMSVTDKY